MKSKKWCLGLLFVSLLVVLTSCGNSAGSTEDSDSNGEGELQTVTVALSPFQDVYSIFVGIDKGFFAEEGIELDIKQTDWAGGNDLLVGGEVDIATASDSDVVLQNANGVNTTLAFPVFYYAGAGLMYDDEKYDWVTYDEYVKEGNDEKEAMRLTLEQLKGKKVGLNTSVSEYTSFISMLNHVGLNSEDFEIVDMGQEDLPPALLSGSIDVMISGIPQRLAVQKEGYGTLIDQSTLPQTVSQNGFAAQRDWLEDHPELADGILKALFKTFHYIEENPEESFPIIVEKMKEVGTEISVDQLESVWNEMEYFPSSKEYFLNEMVDSNGDFYWKDRFENVVNIMESEGKIEKGSIKDLESLHYTLKLVEDLE